jgi:hypothetical protein
MTEEFVVALAKRGFAEPVAKRSAYTTSRLAVLEDGTTKPVLLLLAAKRFGEWDGETHFPFWLDGDYLNETCENVGLATRPHRAPQKRLPRSAYGAPAGSREYMRAYRERNRQRIRETQRVYNAKRREVLQKVRDAVVESDPLLAKLERLASRKAETKNED